MEYIPVRVSDVIRQLNRNIYLPAIHSAVCSRRPKGLTRNNRFNEVSCLV